ncbi:MAG: hypothetical protein KA715_08025 [Xanthomonadaceae bacterium]|nr:hypothetical protein [Xanthomonadaceae bacterium]
MESHELAHILLNQDHVDQDNLLGIPSRINNSLTKEQCERILRNLVQINSYCLISEPLAFPARIYQVDVNRYVKSEPGYEKIEADWKAVKRGMKKARAAVSVRKTPTSIALDPQFVEELKKQLTSEAFLIKFSCECL